MTLPVIQNPGFTLNQVGAAGGVVPSLYANFKTRVYVLNGQPTTFASLFSATGGAYSSDGWTMDTTAGDALSIAAANLPYSATAMSIATAGLVTYADDDTFTTVEFVRWVADGSNYIQHRLDTNSALTGKALFGQSVGGVTDTVQDSTAYSPGTDVPFSIAARHGATFINGAVDGTALTADTTPTSLPDLSGTDLFLGNKFTGTISSFRIWASDIGDAGIAGATR